MKRTSISLSGNDWLVTHSLPEEINPTAGSLGAVTNGMSWGPDRINATVPGDVQSDAIDAGLIPDPAYGLNSRSCEWTYQRDWTYFKTFETEAPGQDCAGVFLVFDGVDHECDVFLNGGWLGHHTGAWTGFEFDISGRIHTDKPNTLVVTVYHAPDEQGQWGRTSAVKSLKARFAYGWDWCTRLVPLGIWKDVRVEYRGGAVIRDIWARPDVDLRAGSASLHVTTEAEAYGNLDDLIRCTLYDGDKIVATCETAPGKTATLDIDDPKLWYPNGYGKQDLYMLKCELADGATGSLLDEKTVTVGLRKLEFERTEGAGEDALPYLIKVNGKRIFLKGFNWAPVHQLYGRIKLDRYRRRVEMAKRANCNFLRVWGGGLAEREEFYELCTRAGILVMQELFQSSSCIDNDPPTAAEYVKMLTETARAVIKEKRGHTSLAVWSGGNELCVRGNIVDIHGKILKPEAYQLDGYALSTAHLPWIPLAPDHPVLAALGKCVAELDPDKLWLHTSASGPIENASLSCAPGRMHDVHGPWMDIGPNKHNDFYNKTDMMLHSEFGSDGAASVQSMNEYIPESMLWPVDRTNPAAWHHGRMWTESSLRRTEAYFGKIDDVVTYSRASRHIQAEGLKYAAEAHRRRKWKCAGAIIWHMAEPWPNVCDTCVIDYDCQPKPAYFTLARAFSPLHCSAKYDARATSAEIWVHNSHSEPFDGRLDIEVWTPEGDRLSNEKQCVAIDPESSALAAVCVLDYSRAGTSRLLILKYVLRDADGRQVSHNWSIHSEAEKYPLEGLRHLPKGQISVVKEPDGTSITITNTGGCVIPGLWLEFGLKDNIFTNDNWLCLMPGESAKIKPDGAYSRFEISAWNI